MITQTLTDNAKRYDNDYADTDILYNAKRYDNDYEDTDRQC